MGELARLLTTVTATILASSLLAVAVRLPRCSRRREPAWLAGLLALLLVRVSAPLPRAAWMIVSLAMAWLAGGFVSRVIGRPARGAWHACCAVPAAVILAALFLGYGQSVPLAAFHAFSLVVLAAFLAPTLVRAWKAARPVTLAAACASTVLWAAASLSVAALSGRPGAPGAWVVVLEGLPVALLAAALGALVLLEGYPWTAGFSGRAAEAAARGRLLGPVYARLLETENALARQDVLVASGFLALGAAHEFKNSLSLVRATAEHGLSVSLPGEKDESLRLVLEQAREGGGAAVAFLERLAREGREAERVVDARDDLERLLRVCRATVRAEGIALRAEIAAGVRFSARPSETGQILLTLVENAVQCLRGRAQGSPAGIVRVIASARDGQAVIEVEDNAGGIPPDAAARLFTVGSSSTGGTGVGLYIARSLAERCGGTLIHVPLEGGSCFRLSFPLVREGSPVA